MLLVWYIFFKILSKTLMFSRALFALDCRCLNMDGGNVCHQPKRPTARLLLFCDCSQYSYHKTQKKNINLGKPLYVLSACLLLVLFSDPTPLICFYIITSHVAVLFFSFSSIYWFHLMFSSAGFI